MNKLINAYENFVPLNPAFAAIDNNWNLLGFVDFGVASTNYFLDIFHNNYVLADILAEEIQSSNVRKINDATLNDNPSDAVWFEKSADDLVVGKKIGLRQRATCASCNVFAGNINFGSSLICGNWNFAKEATFNINNGAPNSRSLCHVVSYIDTYTKVQRYCLHCPEIVTVATPNVDASAQTFAITDFTMPDYVGLKWPVDMISIISAGRVRLFVSL